MSNQASGNGEHGELLGAATEMVQAIHDLRREINSTKSYGRRNRRLIWWTVASVALDLLLSVGLVVSLHRTNDASARANRASSTQVVTCRAGNVTREIQKKLWDTLLAFPPPVGETPQRAVEREAQVAQFRTYLDTAFYQRDCEHLEEERP